MEPEADASRGDAGVVEDAAGAGGSMAGSGGAGGSAGGAAGAAGGKAGSGGSAGAAGGGKAGSGGGGSGGSVAAGSGGSGGAAGAAGGPAPECVTGQLSCDDLDVLTCSSSGTWEFTTTCPYVCNSGVCGGVCVPGAKQCSGLTAQTCIDGQWVTDQTCPYVCAGGSCAGSCVPNTTKCAGSTVQTCDEHGVWQNAASACQHACIAGACTACQPSSLQCSGANAQTCDSAGTWQTTQTCSNGCNGGSCLACTPNARRCNGTMAQQCNQSGQWVTDQTCPFVCSGAGSCGGECVPDSLQCSGLNSQTCDNTGHWQTTTTCQFVCSVGSGSCTGVCTPGAKRCSGTGVQTCDSNGQWQTAVACPSRTNASATCSMGQCGISCNSNFADCNGNAADGCEVNLQNDSNNCNACGRECCGDGVCSAGTCQPAAVVTDVWNRFDMDATNYYTVSSADHQTIVKTPRAGGSSTTFVSAANATKSDVWQLLSDGTNLYWMWDDPSYGSVNISSIPVGGGAITDVANPTTVSTMARSGTDLFWALTGPYGVQWKSLTSSSSGATLSSLNAESIASDGQYLYYTQVAYTTCSGNSMTSTLKRVPVHGGTSELIDSGCGTISSLAVDGSNLYYTRGGTGAFIGLYSFPLWGVGVGGVTPAKLGTGAGSTVSDGTNLYYCAGPLAKRPVGGGSQVLLSDDNLPNGACLGDVKIAGQCVYYRSYDTIVTVNKTP